jgi:hypothetical protein
MKPLKLIAAALVLLPLSQAAYSATITNGNFSAGLTGWSAQGNVSTSSGYAVLSTAGSGESTGGFGGTNGSILSQAINASAGDTISFSYNFLAGDYLPYNDFSLVVGDSNNLLSNIAAVGDYGTTGWSTYSFVATANFTNLFFIISNSGDTAADSSLYIDNVTVTNTPIPAAVWLFGSALTGLVGIGKRRQTKVLTA